VCSSDLLTVPWMPDSLLSIPSRARNWPVEQYITKREKTSIDSALAAIQSARKKRREYVSSKTKKDKHAHRRQAKKKSTERVKALAKKLDDARNRANVSARRRKNADRWIDVEVEISVDMQTRLSIEKLSKAKSAKLTLSPLEVEIRAPQADPLLPHSIDSILFRCVDFDNGLAYD